MVIAVRRPDELWPHWRGRLQYRPIKVVHCISNFEVGGTELNMVRTVERLDRSQFEVRVLVFRDQGGLRERVVAAGIPIDVPDLYKASGPSALKRVRQIFKRLKELSPDVVHCHDLYMNAWVVPCARLAGVPLVISSRRWWKAMPCEMYRIGNAIAYRLSHKVLANSPAVARLMVDDEGISAGLILTLPNFVDDEAFAELPLEFIQSARRRFGIPDGATVVTAVAKFRPEKDLVTLIKAVSVLHARHLNLHLLLVGQGPCEAELRAAAKKNGIRDRVHFAGFLSSPPNPHQYGDLSVLCSLHEGFPNSIIEAMAAGRAVVATRVGGIPDAVDHGKTGLLVEPAAPQELAEAIERLVMDEALRAEMGRTATAQAREAYAADVVVDRLAEVYRTAGSCRLA